MKKSTKRKKIETPPLTREQLHTLSKTDDLNQLRRINEELRKENRRLWDLYVQGVEIIRISSENYLNLMKQNHRLMGIPEPEPEPEPEKEDDTLYPGLN